MTSIVPPVDFIEGMYPEVFAAAKKGDANACLEAYKILHGKHKAESVRYLKKAAKLGNAEAKSILKRISERSRETRNDRKKAAEEIKKVAKLAESGDADKQFQLGYCYMMGISWGVKKDIGKAKLWLEKAALQGNAEAQYYLARCYYFGKSVTVDDGADNSSPDDEDFGVDYKKAKYWFRKAAAQNHREAAEFYDFNEDYTK